MSPDSLAQFHLARLGQVGTAESDIRSVHVCGYRTRRTSAPNPASDHIRIATHSSSAAATKIAVISAPMILTIAVPSSVLSCLSGYAMRMPEADRTQVRDSSSLDEVAATSESGDVPGQWETCPAYEGFSCRLRRMVKPTHLHRSNSLEITEQCARSAGMRW